MLSSLGILRILRLLLIPLAMVEGVRNMATLNTGSSGLIKFILHVMLIIGLGQIPAFTKKKQAICKCSNVCLVDELRTRGLVVHVL